MKLALLVSFVLLGSCSKPPENRLIETDAETKDRAIGIELEAQRHIGLEVSPAVSSEMTEYLQVTGTVQPIDSRVVQVRPLARGRLTTVSAAIGDRVQTGQALAEMDNIEASEAASQLSSARADLQRLKVQLAAIARQADRQKKLSDIGATPAKDYEAARAEQQSAEELIRSQESVVAGLMIRLNRLGVSGTSPSGVISTVIRAPFTGVITKTEAAAGSVVDSEDMLFTVADLSQVWVQAEVYEKDLGRLRLKQPAFIRVDTYPDTRFSGEVTYISDVLDPQTRTARVRCVVSNPAYRLKLDMFASIELPTTFSRTAVNIPTEAIQQVEGRNVVFIRMAPTRFALRNVEVGNQVRERAEITSGLKVGESVVVQGAFHLKSVVVGKELGEEH